MSLEVVGMGNPSVCRSWGTLERGCPGRWQIWGPQGLEEPWEGSCAPPRGAGAGGTPLIAPAASLLLDEAIKKRGLNSYGTAGEGPSLHVGAPSCE